jgi:hypothetical protein
VLASSIIVQFNFFIANLLPPSGKKKYSYFFSLEICYSNKKIIFFTQKDLKIKKTLKIETEIIGDFHAKPQYSLKLKK